MGKWWVRRRPGTAAAIKHLVLLKAGKLDGLWEGYRPQRLYFAAELRNQAGDETTEQGGRGDADGAVGEALKSCKVIGNGACLLKLE